MKYKRRAKGAEHVPKRITNRQGIFFPNKAAVQKYS